MLGWRAPWRLCAAMLAGMLFSCHAPNCNRGQRAVWIVERPPLRMGPMADWLRTIPGDWGFTLPCRPGLGRTMINNKSWLTQPLQCNPGTHKKDGGQRRSSCSRGLHVLGWIQGGKRRDSLWREGEIWFNGEVRAGLASGSPVRTSTDPLAFCSKCWDLQFWNHI